MAYTVHRALSRQRYKSKLKTLSVPLRVARPALQILLLWPIAALAQDHPTPSLARVEAISAERLVARKLNVSPGSTYDVPLKGLQLPNPGAADALVGNSWWEPANFRLVLLEKGIACLDSSTRADSKEKATQDTAANGHLGIWSDGKFRRTHGYPDPPNPITIGQTATAPAAAANRGSTKAESQAAEKKTILDWLLQHWPETATVLGALFSALALITWRRRWEIIIIGTSGVGKTEFVGCLKTDGRWLRHGDPKSTVDEDVTEAKVRGRDGRSIYHLKWCDIGGQYPKWLFERLAKRRRLLLLRRRVVLVLVLSPYKSPDKPVVDEVHIERQFGWVESLVKGFIESRYGKRCKGVMLFVNMLDLFADSPSKSTAVREFQNLFSRHAEVLENSHPNFLCLAGSAKQAWNTNEAWKWIMQAVSGEVEG